MLIGLDIENIAVIEHTSVEFERGLNVITGETGAGKSLLINSLNMVLGARTSREFIREGAPFAKVCATFFCKELDSVLEECGIESDEGNIIITRKIYPDGRNLCHINGSSVNVSLLRSIGERLVVIHGQNDTGELSDTSTHIHFLDAFAQNDALLEDYKKIFEELKEAEGTLSKLDEDESARKREIDYLSYQIDEIEKAGLDENEETELLSRKKLLENAESISSLSEKAYASLSGDNRAKELFYTAKRALQELSSIDEGALPYAEKAAELYYETEELLRDISSYMSGVSYSKGELSEIEDRLSDINSFKRKYGGEIADILKFYDEASEKLSFLMSYDENKDKLILKRDALMKEASIIAEKLTDARKKSAEVLSARIEDELSSLDMQRCKIEFCFTPCPLYTLGAERVEILISTNPSESPKSMTRIASGGEISRIMLAIKSVFSDFDGIPTLLFDEIDTGVSGRAAEKIARKMRALAQNYQLICVTHLPVIAAAAESHLLIEKNVSGEGFKTQIRSLSEEDRIKEIARIISGDNISEISLKNAEELIKGGNLYGTDR